VLRELKRLSHEIDFKNFDQNLQELGLTKGCGWFLKFLGGSDDFIMQKVPTAVYASLRWLNIG
jgi:hypothetical protein